MFSVTCNTKHKSLIFFAQYCLFKNVCNGQKYLNLLFSVTCNTKHFVNVITHFLCFILFNYWLKKWVDNFVFCLSVTCNSKDVM